MFTVIVAMVDNNAFDFDNCNFGITSAFKKKNHSFSDPVKRNTFGKIQFNTVKLEKACSMTSIF